MDITFKTKRLEKIFNSEGLLKKEYGLPNAKKIMLRMAIFKNSPNLSHVPSVPPDRFHQLSGTRKGQYAVDLKHPFRLIFKPTLLNSSNSEDIDLSLVTSIQILGVEDYH